MATDVLLLTGPPGAGKTTAARLIAAGASAGAHIEADAFFHFVRGGYVEPWLPAAHAQNVTVIQAVAAAATAYAEGGYSTVVDGIISPKWFLEPLAQALQNHGLSVSYAILRTSLETCIARTAGRDSHELSDPGVVTQLWNEFADGHGFDTHVLGVTDLHPHVVAEITTQRWRSRSLKI